MIYIVLSNTGCCSKSKNKKGKHDRSFFFCVHLTVLDREWILPHSHSGRWLIIDLQHVVSKVTLKVISVSGSWKGCTAQKNLQGRFVCQTWQGYTSLTPTAHWLEPSHMTMLSCKGRLGNVVWP